LTNPNNFTESLKISQVADIFHEKMPFGGIKGSERKRKRGPVFFYASIDLYGYINGGPLQSFSSSSR
jgi:hypothetical protein